MLVIERSFSVEFQILEQIYFVDDPPELVLYIGTIEDPKAIFSILLNAFFPQQDLYKK